MFKDIVFTFLWSFSPFGESRVGIPVGIGTGLPIEIVFFVALFANLLVFPVFYNIITISNKHLLKNKIYRKIVFYLESRAKTKTKHVIKKYGIWGLMIFVMIPLPVTGAYIGTIAAFVYKINYKKAFIAISSGITISCVLVVFLWPYFTNVLWPYITSFL
tara:strand:- start:397 stop:876 length:480 start_codon:yes stop_codon:yes gene_type:complete